MKVENEMLHFFLVCPPGFEDNMLQELKALGVNIQKIDKGGIEVLATLQDGFELNHKIKISSKILLRLRSFKARDFPKLYSQVLKIEWRKWLWKTQPDLHITTRESRLIHSTRVKGCVDKAIQKNLQSQPAKIKTQNFFDFSPQVYVHIQNDLATLSIDTSYPPLYKRTTNKVIHPASLRENLAHACLARIAPYLNTKSLPIHLIDPMCGSGTFLLESLDLQTNRIYSYQGFPAYQYQAKYKKDQRPPRIFPKPAKLYGLDIDESLIQENIKNYSNISITWKTQDLMSASTEESSAKDACKVLICNPPYNKRLKISIKMKEMVSKMMTCYKPHFIGVIIPNDQVSQIHSIHKSYTELDQVKFRNGGLPCTFVIWKRYL